ncbi:hypothetical protein ACFWNL_26970 [Kitasatospora sp. NPDC058397]|uniref:hypothetical protein n=1 Tax=unclassified Kitasatospora TaxID=2633591 RepID=UPI0036587692
MRSNSVLGECVMRDAEAAFTGGRGDSVRVRTPKRSVAQNFNGTTVYTKVEEGHVQVKLTQGTGRLAPLNGRTRAPRDARC